VARWAGNARQAVERGSRLASQLLVFARVQQLEATRVRVNDVIEGMDELLRRSVGPQVEVKLDLTTDAAVVHTEPTQLEMALLNLAINARDAIDGRGTLTISTDRVSADERPAGLEPGSYVRISVIDDGSGMSADVAARAIDPFFTTKEVGKGTGLGLSMAYGFSRQSGGTLEVASEKGAGTRIDIYLPAVDAAGGVADAAGDAMPAPAAHDAARTGLITIVDDDDGVRTIMADMLSASGYRVESFASPEDALEKANWAESAAVVVDFVMPGMTGAELVDRIRAQVPDQRVIFVTGFAGSTPVDTLKGENTRLLRKPFTNGDLLAAIDSFADSQSATADQGGAGAGK
jgi:CheY-like chemotaxis protein/two-component sensor histidine kinase